MAKNTIIFFLLLISGFAESQNLHNRLPTPPAVGNIVLGNSIFRGYKTGVGDDLIQSAPQIIGNYVGGALTNLSISSSGPRSSYWQLVSNTGFTGTSPLILGGLGFNYTRVSSDTAHWFEFARAGHRAIAAFQFLANIQFYIMGNSGTKNPNVTISGTPVGAPATSVDSLKDYGSRAWYYEYNDPANGTANYWRKSSTTLNETVTITNVQGPGVVIGTWADSVGWSRIGWTVSDPTGTVSGTYDPNGRTIGAVTDVSATGVNFHKPGVINDAIVVTGLTDTLHTIVLTFLDGAKIGGWDYVGGLKSPYQCTSAPIYIFDNPHMNSTGYATTGGVTTQAILDAASDAIYNNLISTFPGYQNSIIRVNENAPGFFDPTDAAQLQSDGVHPTAKGNIGYLKALIAKITPFQPSEGTTTITTSSVLAQGSVYDLQYKAGVNTGLFSGDPNFKIDSTNIILNIGNMQSSTGSYHLSALNVHSSGTAAVNIGGHSAAEFFLIDSSQSANHKVWEVLNFGGTYSVSRLNDANSSRTYREAILDNGNAGINSGNSTWTPGYTWDVGGTGTLHAAGATTLSSSLGVTGATTLSSTLGVTGLSTLGLVDQGSGYVTSGFSWRQGDLTTQSNDAVNAFYGYNTQIAGGVYKYVATKAAEFMVMNGAGTAIGGAASGSAGATITPIYAAYFLNNGHSLLGTLTDASALVPIGASTTTIANLNIAVGTKKTTMAQGDLSASSGHLYYHDGSTDYDLLAAGGGYTLPTATTSVLGGVKIDGTSITISGGVISASGSATGASYTSTLTNTTNISSSTFTQAVYTQVGNIVTVTISGAFTPTASSTATTLTFSLPVTTSTTSQSGIGGGALALNAGGLGYTGLYASVVSGTTGQIYSLPTTTTSCNFSITMQYHTN